MYSLNCDKFEEWWNTLNIVEKGSKKDEAMSIPTTIALFWLFNRAIKFYVGSEKAILLHGPSCAFIFSFCAHENTTDNHFIRNTCHLVAAVSLLARSESHPTADKGQTEIYTSTMYLDRERWQFERHLNGL